MALGKRKEEVEEPTYAPAVTDPDELRSGGQADNFWSVVTDAWCGLFHYPPKKDGTISGQNNYQLRTFFTLQPDDPDQPSLTDPIEVAWNTGPLEKFVPGFKGDDGKFHLVGWPEVDLDAYKNLGLEGSFEELDDDAKKFVEAELRGPIILATQGHKPDKGSEYGQILAKFKEVGLKGNRYQLLSAGDTQFAIGLRVFWTLFDNKHAPKGTKARQILLPTEIEEIKKSSVGGGLKRTAGSAGSAGSATAKKRERTQEAEAEEEEETAPEPTKAKGKLTGKPVAGKPTAAVEDPPLDERVAARVVEILTDAEGQEMEQEEVLVALVSDSSFQRTEKKKVRDIFESEEFHAGAEGWVIEEGVLTLA